MIDDERIRQTTSLQQQLLFSWSSKIFILIVGIDFYMLDIGTISETKIKIDLSYYKLKEFNEKAWNYERRIITMTGYKWGKCSRLSFTFDQFIEWLEVA